MSECRIITADVLDGLAQLESGSVHCCVTSPPYFGLRDYKIDGQLGLERTPEEYIARMVEVFREVRRVLRDDGTLWLNIGDSYAGSTMSGGNDSTSTLVGPHHVEREARLLAQFKRSLGNCKPKDLLGIPWMLAFALRADGWYLRCDIIWAKPNPMPESVTDRPTKAHEYLFLLAKGERYYYDADAIRTPAPLSVRIKMPDGWDTGAGAHGSFHRNGREKGKTDKQRGHSRRHDGSNDRWDAMEKNGQIVNGANARSVWTIATEPYPEAHFATFPTALVKPCVLAGSPADGTVLDPFMGSGTTGLVALQYGRSFIGIELSPEYVALAEKRIAPVLHQGQLDFAASEEAAL